MNVLDGGIAVKMLGDTPGGIIVIAKDSKGIYAIQGTYKGHTPSIQQQLINSA